MIGTDGFVVFESDQRVLAWAGAASEAMRPLRADPDVQDRNLRHGRTWFVGVDVLPNDIDGSVSGVPFVGPWSGHVPNLPQHRGQVSIVYPGYPKKDAEESDASHRYRVTRCAAHVDGLLPVGDARRRFAREYHAYILGIPLGPVADAPTVVWRGSQRIMQAALVDAIGDASLCEVDITDAYHAARREVFERCECVPVLAQPGQCYLIHRFALHGTAPWKGPKGPGRMVAFFRPEFADPADWLFFD